MGLFSRLLERSDSETEQYHSDDDSVRGRQKSQRRLNDKFGIKHEKDVSIHISVWANGYPNAKPVNVTLTRRHFPTWLSFMDHLTKVVGKPHYLGAIHYLYDLDGRELRHFADIESRMQCVAAAGKFVPGGYGEDQRGNFRVTRDRNPKTLGSVDSRQSREMYLQSRNYLPYDGDVWDYSSFDMNRAQRRGNADSDDDSLYYQHVQKKKKAQSRNEPMKLSRRKQIEAARENQQKASQQNQQQRRSRRDTSRNKKQETSTASEAAGPKSQGFFRVLSNKVPERAASADSRTRKKTGSKSSLGGRSKSSGSRSSRKSRS